MNKKFVFVNLHIGYVYAKGINHGLAFLTPIVKKHSYSVSCLNIRNEISEQEFIKKINNLNPSIVGFSCTSQQLKYLVKYSKALKKYPNLLQIAGGVGPTLEPDCFLFQSAVKGLCIGEGEIPLDNLLDNLKNKKNIFNTEGFYWRINNEIKKNAVPHFIQDLSAINFPDYSIFEKELITYRRNLLIMLGRGCPNNCYYCCNKARSNVYPANKGYFRLPSVEYCIRLIETTVAQYPETKSIALEDDNLIGNKIWFENFAREYRKRINIPYISLARIEYITPDIAKMLKESGCMFVMLGLESGNEYLRSKFLNRKHSNRLFIEKCNMIKAAGLEVFTFNIVGLPFEGKKEMKDTLRLNKKISPNYGICTFFYPYKGTELYRICKQENLLKNKAEMLEINNLITKPSIKMTKAQEKDCIYYQKKILNYLKHQGRLTHMSKCQSAQIARLPLSIKKCLCAMGRWSGSFLLAKPLLSSITEHLYRLLRVEILVKYFVKRGRWS